MIQLSIFNDTRPPHHEEIKAALTHALNLWHRNATEIKPPLNGSRFLVTFSDGTRASVDIRFIDA